MSLNAKMAPFAGYVMPIQYKSIIFEHNATRNAATVFDTCHMGEFSFSGSDALYDLERILSCPVEDLKPGQCRYGLICNESGGVIDDQIIYRLGEHEFFMVVNASTEEKDFQWITAHLSECTSAKNLSSQTAKIDLQGPGSPKICSSLMEKPINGLKYYHFMYNRYRGESILLSRTGYTGEIGFEFYSTPELALKFWDDCINAGAIPAGLGARDTLRLEMGYPLYGHELDESSNAGWSGFTRAIGKKKFIGSDAISAESGKEYFLCGLLLEDRRSARSGDSIVDSAGSVVGRVTSGSFSPSLGRSIALGYLREGFRTQGANVSIVTERGMLAAIVAETPFYKGGSARARIEDYL